MRNLKLLLFMCFLTFSMACGEDVLPEEANPMLILDQVTWTFNGQEYTAMGDDVSSTISNNTDANNKHMRITATTEENDVLNIYAQKLFGGGTGTCMELREYPSKTNNVECFDDGFLIICTLGVCEFTTADDIKYTPTQEVGSVSITMCDDENQNTTGSFSVEVSTEGQDPILIEGEFSAVEYDYENN